MVPSHSENDSGIADWLLRCLFLTCLFGPFLVGHRTIEFDELDRSLLKPIPSFIIMCALLILVTRRHNFIIRTVGFWFTTYSAIFALLGIFTLPGQLKGRTDPIDWAFLQPQFQYAAPLIWVAFLNLCANLIAQISLTSNAPLRTHVRGFIEQGLKLPCYVAVAELQNVFDSDNPTYVSVSTEYAPLRPEDIHPLEIPKYLPAYVRLNDLNQALQISYAVASAALPFGIVPSERIAGAEFVDGGVADNCPVFPLVMFENCDVLITVHLRPDAPLSDAKRHFESARRLHELRDASTPASLATQDFTLKLDVRPVQEAAESTWPKHFAVMPDQPLGCLLDFRKSEVARRIAEGLRKGEMLATAITHWAAGQRGLISPISGSSTSIVDDMPI